jgi:hypothetical protein
MPACAPCCRAVAALLLVGTASAALARITPYPSRTRIPPPRRSEHVDRLPPDCHPVCHRTR